MAAMPVELPPLPPGYATTREGLHALTEHVLSPLRHRAEGRIGLQPTAGGFGPPLPDGRTVAVEADRLVDGARSEPITTLGAAASFLDVPVGAPTDVYQPVTDADPERSLGVDPDAAAAIGQWFTFGRDVLAELAASADPEDEPTEIQLWPEHFDLALSIGPEGARVNVGASPGDGDHDEPYLYVGPWDLRPDDGWNESWGASLGYAAIRAGADPLEFVTQARDRTQRTV
jgi:hypothetical protein